MSRWREVVIGTSSLFSQSMLTSETVKESPVGIGFPFRRHMLCKTQHAMVIWDTFADVVEVPPWVVQNAPPTFQYTKTTLLHCSRQWSRSTIQCLISRGVGISGGCGKFAIFLTYPRDMGQTFEADIYSRKRGEGVCAPVFPAKIKQVPLFSSIRFTLNRSKTKWLFLIF